MLNFHKLTDEECISILRIGEGLPTEILQNPQLMKMLLPTMKADFEVIETWKAPSEIAPLPVPIWAFAGIDDFAASPETMKAWDVCTQKEFRLGIFPGGHYFAFDVHSRAAIIQLVNTALARYIEY